MSVCSFRQRRVIYTCISLHYHLFLSIIGRYDRLKFIPHQNEIPARPLQSRAYDTETRGKRGGGTCNKRLGIAVAATAPWRAMRCDSALCAVRTARVMLLSYLCRCCHSCRRRRRHCREFLRRNRHRSSTYRAARFLQFYRHTVCSAFVVVCISAEQFTANAMLFCDE